MSEAESPAGDDPDAMTDPTITAAPESGSPPKSSRSRRWVVIGLAVVALLAFTPAPMIGVLLVTYWPGITAPVTRPPQRSQFEGLRFATAADIKNLEERIAALPHVTSVKTSYWNVADIPSWTLSIDVQTDLDRERDPAGPTAAALEQLKEGVLRVLWRSPFDAGTVRIWARGVLRPGSPTPTPDFGVLLVNEVNIQGLYLRWGKPVTSPTPVPSPSSS